MYEELVKSLRQCAEASCAGCKNDLVEIGCRGKLQIEAANAVEELEKSIPRWIPVTERLPDNIDEEVLVCNEEYGKSILGFVTVAIYDGSDWIECWKRKTCLAAVTHWMPLPEPPKEET